MVATGAPRSDPVVGFCAEASTVTSLATPSGPISTVPDVVAVPSPVVPGGELATSVGAAGSSTFAPGASPGAPVEVVVVRRSVGALDIAVGRVVDASGDAWGWAVAAVIGAGVLLLAIGLAAATFARHRLTAAVAKVSVALDRAAVGDFSERAPETELAPELTELSGHVNRTLDRLEELLAWLRDSADQLAHDFRTPLARATARLETLGETATTPQMKRLVAEARADLQELTRAMNEAMALRDGAAWSFEPVRLDTLAAQAAELYEPLADERGVSIRVVAEAVEVLGVRSLLQRATANLVDNAVKYSPDGGVVTLTVATIDGRPRLPPPPPRVGKATAWAWPSCGRSSNGTARS